MKYTIRHNCGHPGTIELFGPSRQRDYKLARAKERPCPACIQQTTAERAAEQAEEWALPPLSGTEKQIAWALTLRYRALTIIERVLGEAGLDRDEPRPVPASLAMEEGETYTINRLIAKLIDHDTARWWIDRAAQITRRRDPETDPFAPTEQELAANLLRSMLGGRELSREEWIEAGLAVNDPMLLLRGIF